MSWKIPHALQRKMQVAGAVGVLAVAAISVLIISDHYYIRADLTRDRRYTLTRETHHVLQQIKSPVTIHFYYSRGVRELPAHVKDYARRVEDLLQEYAIAGGQRLSIRKIDVTLQSETEDAARIAGIEPQLTPDGTAYYYLGLDIDCVEQSKKIPALLASQESVLEYHITRAIQQVHNPSRPKIGLLSSLPIEGPQEEDNPFRVRSQRRAWMFLQELRLDYEVTILREDLRMVPDDVNLLILLHPQKPAPGLLYAVDQFLLHGGRLIVLVDPCSIYDARGATMGGPGLRKPSQSDLTPLFTAWGIQYDPSRILVDLGYALRPPQGIQPAFIEIDSRGLSSDDPATAALEKILFPYAGAFTGTPAEGLKQSTLIQSSQRAWLVESKRVLAGLQFDRDLKDAEAGQYDVALKLQGSFPSAFAEAPEMEEIVPVDLDDIPVQRPHLKRSETPSAVILVADSDFLWNELWIERRINPHNQKNVHIVTRDNNNFLQNAVDQLSGESNLIQLRSRSVNNPIFTRVQDLRQKTAEAQRREMAKIQEAFDETHKRLIAIAQVKQGVDQWIESPEERGEKEGLNQRLAELRKNRQDLERWLNAEIDQLGRRLMLLNVGIPPLLVILGGVLVWIRRRIA